MIIRKIINTIFLIIIFCCVFWSVFTEFGFKDFAECSVSIAPPNIRVGLMREIPSISFCVQGDYVIAEGYHGDLIVAATPGQKYTVTKTDEGLALFEGNRLLGVFSNNIAVKKVITEIVLGILGIFCMSLFIANVFNLFSINSICIFNITTVFIFFSLYLFFFI
ncbi:hypothetical protein M1N51_00995 [Peptococcaceae bacterium]|nr:hypothetical protein [Peptococcaceae bacterium]MCL0071780.1 hypothetical protein [Peptococcaceae bacterium]